MTFQWINKLAKTTNMIYFYWSLSLEHVFSCIASHLCIPLYSDSGESLFITQSRTKAVRTGRRLGSSKRAEPISDDSGNGRENDDTENERGSAGQRVERPKRRIRSIYISPRKATFPFLLKSLRRQHLSLKKHQVLEVGFIYATLYRHLGNWIAINSKLFLFTLQNDNTRLICKE